MRYFYLALLFIYSCSYLDNEDIIPAYLVIDEVSLTTEQGEGAATHNIRDVWVYADGELLGVFNLPTRIPVITSGTEMQINIFAGIRNNGAVGQPFIYQLYERSTSYLDLKPGDEINLIPEFKYSENVKFDFVEGFEAGNIFSDVIENSGDASLSVTSDMSRSGINAGYFSLDEDNSKLYLGTEEQFSRSNNAGSDTYLELDYKNTIPLIIGMRLTSNGIEKSFLKIILDPKEDWNKIYIDFTEDITDPTIDTYQLFLGSDLKELSDNEGEIYIDNVKMVHF